MILFISKGIYKKNLEKFAKVLYFKTFLNWKRFFKNFNASVENFIRFTLVIESFVHACEKEFVTFCFDS